MLNTFVIEGLLFPEAVKCLATNCNNLLHEHATYKTRTITEVATAPWFDKEYKDLRAKRRKAEKKWKRTNDDSDHIAYIELREESTSLAAYKKKQYLVK